MVCSFPGKKTVNIVSLEIIKSTLGPLIEIKSNNVLINFKGEGAGKNPCHFLLIYGFYVH